MKRIILAAMAAAAISSCTGSKPQALILYYSQCGTTEAVAKELQSQIGADICRFDVEEAYTGTFEETISRCQKERETGFVPQLKKLGCDLSKYDVIFLGYPIWFGTYAPPVKALLNSVNLDSKTVVPFCSFGSGGLQSSIADLREALPDCIVMNGYGVRTARVDAASEELNRFLIENGWKKGAIEPLPDFSEQQAVTAEQAAIFDEACSNYQFPLGVPSTAAKRTIPGGTEYLFTVEGLTPDGQPSSTSIYVTDLDGKVPVFTQVVR